MESSEIRKMTLTEWADSTFEGVKPSIITMRRWAVLGKFSVKAEKIGRTWYVPVGARFTGKTRSDVGHTRNNKKKK